MRVLIVEDEFLVAMDLVSIVESLGHNVVGPAQSARSAIALAQSQQIDVALLDMNLVTDTAAPVADELDERGVPYAVVTAYLPDQLGKRFKSALLVSKPFHRRDIEAAIECLRPRT